MTRLRALIVDDEPQIHRILKPALAASGYDTLHAETAAEALRLAASFAPDIVLLDLGLPDRDGKDVLRDLRQFTRAPVVIISARDREAEKIEALDLGADDYIEKPFAMGELLARLRAALRHASGPVPSVGVIKAGDLSIDLDRRQVSKRGDMIHLTPREYDLLAILARHAGRVVTHRQILTAVWGPAHTDDTQYLRVFVGQLRAKVEDTPTDPKLIRTEAGVGYRFADIATK